MKYTKADLEKTVMVQFENLNAQNKYIQLLMEQNELLVEFNHKLTQELSENYKEPKPYHVPRRRKNKNHYDDDAGGAVL